MRTALADVSNAEQVKKFAILPEPFSVAAEELTVSMKLRRDVIVSRYASPDRGAIPRVKLGLSLSLERYR